eukprot:TRINITY_DN4720_c0_g1_i2.p2 TRINITY_DN4720_c0_g1~~TRINITY_DN4720_c0_g1_i2.p2  ORF type:complete len:252 (-),score=26.82 TRINITY_DN4720_c0_g1_i2:103-774(-)
MLIQQSRQSLPSTAPFKGVIGLKRCNSRCARLKVYAQKDGRQPWNFMRFFQTLSFYNQIKGPQEIISSFLQGPQPQEKLGMRLLGDPSMSMESDVVLVVGATGGVGKRVVGELLKKGRKVRGLVRNYEKAQKLLAGLEATGNAVLEVVAADLTQRYSESVRWKCTGSQETTVMFQLRVDRKFGNGLSAALERKWWRKPAGEKIARIQPTQVVSIFVKIEAQRG